VLTDIHALADRFLIAFPNINRLQEVYIQPQLVKTNKKNLEKKGKGTPKEVEKTRI